MNNSERFDPGKFKFRGLHSKILIGMASDRYAGWTGQVYSEGRYAQGRTRRTHKIGEKSFLEEVLPVESVEEYGVHPKNWTKYVRVMAGSWFPEGEKGSCHEKPTALFPGT
jgi:hypothetical protein